MFQGDRWADAFMAVCGDHAAEGVDTLKAFVSPLSRLPGQVSGNGYGARVEKMLRSALGTPGPGAEYAIRFVVLLIRRGCFKHLNAALRAVEQRLDAKRGVLTVNTESVRPLDDELQERIKAGLIKRYGAREVRLVSQIVPELLDGYRLCIGTEVIDSSLKGQIQKMAKELHAADVFGVAGRVGAASDGGFR
jgi:F-type H+-transporting ATPase subunit delta